MHDFLSNSYRYFLSISYRFRLFEIFDFKVFRIWPWPLTHRGHLGSKIFSPFESPYIHTWLPMLVMMAQRLARRDWRSGCPRFKSHPRLTFQSWSSYQLNQLGSKAASDSTLKQLTTCGVSNTCTLLYYLTSIDIFSLSRTVFEKIRVKIFRVKQNGGFWPFQGQGHWPIYFISRKGSDSHQTASNDVSRVKIGSILSILCRFQDFKGFRVWPWPLTIRGHLGSTNLSLFESSYMTSYLTSIDPFSLSPTVFEIFDLKKFMVWPWPLTFRGHLRSKIFSPFESSCITSYLTSIDTFSLSRTVFEIFDFKVFRVWPGPLEITSGQNCFHHSKAYTWLPI